MAIGEQDLAFLGFLVCQTPWLAFAETRFLVMSKALSSIGRRSHPSVPRGVRDPILQFVVMIADMGHDQTQGRGRIRILSYEETDECR